MIVKLEETVYFDFTTHRFDTGAATDADSTPTVEVFEDNTDTTVTSLTAAKRTSKTGNYRVPVTAAAASGFEVGKSYNVVASATVNSVTGKGVVGRFVLRSRSTDDLAYPATSGRSLAVDASGRVDLGSWLGSAPNVLQSGRIDSYLGAVASGVIAAASFASGALDAVWSTATRTLTAISDSSGVTTLLSRLTAGRATALDNLDATVSSRSTYAGADTSGTTTLLGRLTSGRAGNLDNLDATVSSRLAAASYTTPLDASGVRTAVGLAAANLDTQIATLATASALSTVAGYVDTEVAAIKAKTDNLPAAPAATGDIPSAVSIATQVRTELGTELARIDATTSSRLAAASYVAPDNSGIGSAAADAASLVSRLTAGRANNLDNLDRAISAVLTTAMTESYNADGVAPTPAQALFAILQRLTEFAISDTTITVKKLDGATTAFTLTLDDATAPTSSTRSA